ncbi:MAG: ATP-dependent DNA helicase RecG [Spirochaetota bacterium]
MFLRELKTSIRELKGVGPAAQEAYASLHIHTFFDLLAHQPRSYEDRKHPVSLASAAKHGSAYTVVTVAAHEYFGSWNKKTLKIIVFDESASASLLCFGRNFLSRVLPVGARIHLYGTFFFSHGELQCSTFDTEPYGEHAPRRFGKILPIYPLSAGLSQAKIRRDISQVLRQSVSYLEEELPKQLQQRRELEPVKTALGQLHYPDELHEAKKARRSLAYTELFYLQLTLLRRSQTRRQKQKTATTGPLPSELMNQLIGNLPFQLTKDQHQVIKEIYADLHRAFPMNRLLQGDVGSGKTLTGFISMLPIIESGGQAAFMAPTELLAKQHAENAARFLEPLGLSIAFLTGSVTGSRRNHLLEALREGSVDLVVGTHALFSESVVFNNLQYVIIDEQQRFGVSQRILLSEKGTAPHQLLMTATPIPRTMALTLFGDLDISTIKTMPPGRKPVITHLASEESRNRVYQAVEVEFSRGHQAYLVYPRIEADGQSDLRDVESMYQHLSHEVYTHYRGALIHSRLPEEEKMAVMHQFKEHKLDYIVSTSVVEVGVDVPNATCMVIEHAERFGLSALHQLRGRVGRGEQQAYAFLIYSKTLQKEGKQRLKVMKETHDGFKIAEEDLVIRGPGEIAGRRQSGYLSLDFADIVRDLELMKEARQDAGNVLETDSGLLQPEHAVIQRVLSACPPFDERLIE